MANLPSAKKRIKQNERNRIRNRARKTQLKTETRKFQDAIHDGNLDTAKELLVQVTKRIDQIAAKGTLADAHPGRGLTAFVFIAINQLYDALDIGGNKTCRYNISRALILFDILFQYRIEDVVGW